MTSAALKQTSLWIAAGLLGLASAAQAATVTWNSSAFTQNATNSGNYGNSYSATSGDVKLTVTAFSSLGGGGGTGLTTANIVPWSGGFGVRNQNEGLSAGSPDHSMDNGASTDMLALNFTNAAGTSQVKALLTSLTIGWSQTDSDLSVLSWGGAAAIPTIGGRSMSQLLSDGWVLVNNYANLAVNTARSTGAPAARESSWWIVSAYDSDWGSGSNTANLSNGDDYVKLLKMVTETPDPPREVPEPGSLALLALGVAGLAIMRRRRPA